jgi:DNA invertase Pin-like site-specific DNA recombinase
MNSKIQIHHRQKMAYVYLRQSTMAQVYHYQESTQRQYALQDRALELGWPPDQIRVLEGDRGLSGLR